MGRGIAQHTKPFPVEPNNSPFNCTPLLGIVIVFVAIERTVLGNMMA